MDKYCSGCKETKDISLFSRNKQKKDGYANWCKLCIKTLSQRPESAAKRKQRRMNDYAHTLYIETKSRARLSGIAFDLDKSDCLIPDTCPVLGIPLIAELGGRKENTPSLDKIIPSKGYVKGNVKVISWLANCIKRDCTDPEVFEKIATYLRSTHE